MPKLINLDSNESVEISHYGSEKNVFLPAVILYWGVTANLAIDYDGLLMKGKANNDEFLSHVENVFRVPIRSFLGSKASRPFVANGKRVFAIADKRTAQKIEAGDYD